MIYEEWERTVPEAVTQDTIWRVQAFRLATFLTACAERDTRSISGNAKLGQMCGQLCRAAGSIAANIAEGYPRVSVRDRLRYYEYALGSAAEVKVWYLALEPSIGAEVLEQRFLVLRSITRLLITMIRSGRAPKPGPAAVISP